MTETPFKLAKLNTDQPTNDAMPNATCEQELLEFMWTKAGAQQARRTQTAVYKPVLTPEGINTHCYEFDLDLEPWIYKQVTPKDLYPAHYNTLTTKPRIIDYLIEHLSKQPDPRFPFLVKCHTLFSFRNGIYNADNDQFYWYNQFYWQTPPGPKVKTASDLDANITTTQYFGYAVPTHGFEPGFDYRSIPVTDYEQIFVNQNNDSNDMDHLQHVSGKENADLKGLESTEAPESKPSACHLADDNQAMKTTYAFVFDKDHKSAEYELSDDSNSHTFIKKHLVGECNWITCVASAEHTFECYVYEDAEKAQANWQNEGVACLLAHYGRYVGIVNGPAVLIVYGKKNLLLLTATRQWFRKLVQQNNCEGLYAKGSFALTLSKMK